MALLRLLTVVLAISQCSVVVKGSHFRGGVISWRPVSPNVASSMVDFDYRVAFRRSFSNDHFCDAGTIASGANNPGEGSLQCDNGCNGLNDDFDYRCTDFSVDGDWTTGVGESVYDPDANSFDVFYAGGNWISLANGGNGGWILRSRVNLTPRPDNGLINSSPTTAAMPIARVQQNCEATLNIPITDPDGDTVRCRFAVNANGIDECDSICGSFDGIILDEDSCTITWTPFRTGLFGVAIQIEDFISPTSTIPLSSVPLQFLFDVFQADGNCAEAPVFDPVVLPPESCIAVPTGGTFTTRIEAVVSDPTRSIVAINTVSPVGLTTSAVQQVPGSPIAYFVDVTFTSSDLMQLQQIFCFVAEDNGGLTSEQRCIFLVTATQPPVATSVTLDSANVLTITADQQITIPSSARLISIMSLNTGQEVISIDTSTDATVSPDGMSLIVSLTVTLSSADTFVANLARGVFETNDFCGVENEPGSFVIMPEGPAMIDCPMDIFLVLSNNENTGFVSWDAPIPPSGTTQVAGPFVTQGMYPRGTNTSILYIFQTANNDYEFCRFNVEVGPDPHPCPDDMVVYALRGTGGTIVTWDEPASRDRIITAPVPSGSFLPPGITCVSYSFNSVVGSVDSCDFDVEVIEVSPCDDEPCDNDGICIASTVDSFQCVCEDGCYIGQACEIGIHACAIDQPCMNGGTCELVEGSCSVYYCECPPCFTGPNCETAIDPCATGLCKDGSECVVMEGSCQSYSCECDECVFGAFCEFEVPNPCDLDPCEDGFGCARNPENCYGYICLSPEPDPSCVSGGIEIPVQDVCLSSPCQNFGVCVLTRSWSEEGFTCLCTEGFGGYLCDEVIDDNPDIQGCSNTTCLNNATCVNSFTSYQSQDDAPCEYTCICEEGYSGVDCARPAGEYSPCSIQENEPCLNGGVCRNIFISPRNDVNFICSCPVGYGGHRCEVEMADICASAPCMNDGTCSRKGTFFQCDCAAGFAGDTCEDQVVVAVPPVLLACPEPIVIISDVPVSVQWVMPSVVDLSSNAPVRLVSANASPGAVYNPGHFQEVELVFEAINGLQATCEFWIYINPISIPVTL